MKPCAAAIEIFLSSVLCLLFSIYGYAQEEKPEPVIVNGDTVEYLTEGREVTATGNVSVIHKGAKLSCDKLTVNTVTKNGVATGNARLEDEKGVIEGEEIRYNFQTKTGAIVKPNFRSNPYFGRAEKARKISDAEFIAERGYMTTCNYSNPHYRIKSRKMDFFPDNKVETKDDIFYAGKAPLLYLPELNRSLKDPLMHMQVMPGKKKDWGLFTLTASRYNLTEDVSGRIYFDYRSKLGVAEGFGVNYNGSDFGRGDYKYYYTQERDHNIDKTDRAPRIFQRYFIRWRHQWDIDRNTNLTSEYYKIVDSKMAVRGSTNNILKDYFFREYEKDAEPPSYALLHHNFNYGSMDFTVRKRTNRWYSAGYVEKLPEIKYSLPSYQLLDTPFYFENSSTAGNFNKKNTSTMTPAANDTNPDAHVNRLDTTNKFSLPMKAAFIRLTPFVSERATFYDGDVFASPVWRAAFFSGADASTKFYRVFAVKSNFLNLDINGLRHIITPTIGYSFNHEPSILSSRLRQIDGVDSLTRSNSASLGLSNKLQTKRNNQRVDFLDLNVTDSYNFKPKTGAKRGSSLSDFLFTLKVLPYSWMSINSEAVYKHSGARSAAGYNHFSSANYDVNFYFGEERTFSWAQRYQFKGGNELIFNVDWRLNPKWKFIWYRRYERGHDPALKRGMREQEYTISRDLHCWTFEITYNQRRGQGETVFFLFRLKAFPEMEFEFNKEYNAPKPGSQSNP